MEPAPSLYKRLTVVDATGTPQAGRAAIALIVDDFVANVVADPVASPRFKALPPAQVAQFKTKLADQICEATGGPCGYYGRTMKEAHAGMKVTEAEWYATVAALVKALDKHGIPPKEYGELLAALAPMKKDIVGQ
jgi:hemoglobin